ncbi:MAG: hypothetical protein CMF55_06835 [Legionellales bacterium]|nr:hypothetical protein [Legionellales bacterium]HAG62125.1 hypothetical protein [Coxiellaceae bacterium]|tara:strand:+ start:255 stop:629 length:375 start_codon:yes stop_codon:yes gene_type:complete
MIEKIFTRKEMKTLKDNIINHEQAEEYGERWEAVFSGLDSLRISHVAASDNQTAPFMEEARRLVIAYTGKDQQLTKKLKTLYQSHQGAELLRHQGFNISDELYRYYEQAWKAHIAETGFFAAFK